MGTQKRNRTGIQILESHIANNSPSLDFVTALSSNYSVYGINIVGLTQSVQSNLEMVCSSDSGLTWLSTDYAWNNLVVDRADSAIAGSDSDSKLVIQRGGLYPSINNTFMGEYKLYKFTGGSTRLNGYIMGANYIYPEEVQIVGGVYIPNTNINALKIYPASGYLISGTVTVWGLL